MKKIILIIIILCSLSAVKTFAQPNFEWAVSLEGANDTYGVMTTPDQFGNVFITGSFAGTVDFDPGVGTNLITAVGSSDIFIQKFDSLGNELWVATIGGASSQLIDVGNNVEIDSRGNVYIIGSFGNTIDFDPGIGVHNKTAQGVADMFVLKLDSSGNFLWANTSGGLGYDRASGLHIDGAENIYISGAFESLNVDFDPGAGTSNLSSNGASDIFLQKLDSAGNLIWVKSFGDTSNDDYGSSITSDPSNGDVFFTGYYKGVVDFNPGVGVNNLTTVGGPDGFVLRLDSNSNFQWVKSIGGTGANYVNMIQLDDFNNIYICGQFEGTIDFNPGAAVVDLVSQGFRDVYILKLDAIGDYIWAESIGEAGFDAGFSIEIDNIGDIYVSGEFSGTIDIDPGIGIVNLISNGGGDAFILKLNNNGEYVWSTSFGSSQRDWCVLNLDNIGNIYVTGTFNETVDFDPGSGVTNLTSNGVGDAFLFRLSQNIVSTIAVTEVKHQTNFNIYPNPTMGELNISDHMASITQARIIDLNGRVVKSFNSNFKNIDVSDLPKGMYVLQLQTSDKSWSERFVKN